MSLIASGRLWKCPTWKCPAWLFCYWICCCCLGLLPVSGLAQGTNATTASAPTRTDPSTASQLAPDTRAPSPNTLLATDLITNASEAELRAISGLFTRLDRGVAARDAAALRFYGVITFPVEYSVLRPQARLTHIAVSPAGALVRQTYEVTGAPDNRTQPTTLSSGKHELWLTRLPDNSFAFTTQQWADPNDAVSALADAAREEWNNLRQAETSARGASTETTSIAARASVSNALGANAAVANGTETADAQADKNGVMLHLVAAQRGGRWLALRRSRWNGALFDRVRLGQLASNNTANGTGEDNIAEWLTRQMARFPADRSGIYHFLLQRSARGWVGLNTVIEPNSRLNAAAETAASSWRQQIQGSSYLSAVAHRDFGVALSKVGLFVEAAAELEKAEALQPNLIGAAGLRRMQDQHERDLQSLATRQLQDEAKVGLGAEHPGYVINALYRLQQTQPTTLNALRIGLEYSKLADDTQAANWLASAQQMITRGAMRGVNTNDAGWINLLHEHLQDRKRLAPLKPPTILRSALFTVRCWPNDFNALKLLAALEEAQHTVYADFGVPMGSTEVVLWRNQREFQDYTNKFSEQAISEFVAALTLTKLVSTQEGPVVLGEEVNVFIDPRADPFSTVAHEYGHVAVRHLSRGRFVPVWFNEGIASAVEGGYDGYLLRVRRAADAERLLSMRQMQEWDVDGERAFLAYSQANSIIDYIVANPRWNRAAILEILRQIGRDVPPDQAFRSVLGVSQQELWNAWAREGIK